MDLYVSCRMCFIPSLFDTVWFGSGNGIWHVNSECYTLLGVI